jgi:sugar phosphate isomerase/epimerase
MVRSMKISFPLGAIEAKVGTEKALLLSKEAGFDAVDYGLGELVDDNSALSGDGYREHAENIRKMADKIGIEINQTHAPFTFPYARWNSPDEFENVIMPRFYRTLEISGILGASVSVVHPLHHFTYCGHEEEIFNLNMDYYRRLIPYAKEYNVKIGVENMFQVDPRRKYIIPDTCASIDEFVRYIDTLNSDAITACLDIGHIGLAQREHESWDFVRALGHDRLGSLHVHDNDYRADMHILPGCGKMNWERICRALAEVDYKGSFNLEADEFYHGFPPEYYATVTRFMHDTARTFAEKIEAYKSEK